MCLETVSSVYTRESVPMKSQQYGVFNKEEEVTALKDSGGLLEVKGKRGTQMI